MAEAPLLMENTKNHTFSVFNEKVLKRNSRFFRPVYRNEVTQAMCKSAGLSGKEFAEKKAVEVVETPPVAAPAMEEAPPQAETLPQAPDFSGWDEDTLRNYCQENDIPTHPAAKSAGLQAAITRFFDELEAQSED